MRRFYISLICSMLLLSTVACDENSKQPEQAKQLEFSCQTTGFTSGENQTYAVWEEGDNFYLYRSEDWSAALLRIMSVAGSNSATFSGKAKSTNGEYYAVSPALAAGAVRSNGEIAITVAPNNIILAGENTAAAIPQVGVESGANQLSFTPIFGALQVDLSEFDAITSVNIVVPSNHSGLYGTFTYNLPQGKISGEEGASHSLTRKFSSPHDISSNRCIYIAMPEGEYSHIDVIVRNEDSFEKSLYSVENFEIKRGEICSAQASHATLPAIVDSWRIKSFENSEAVVDIYIQFNIDNTFVLYQRNNTLEYTRFDGSYTIDEATSTLSGVYSDGSQWAESYTFQVEGGILTMVGTHSNEKFCYEVATIPASAQERATTLAARGIKRAL